MDDRKYFLTVRVKFNTIQEVVTHHISGIYTTLSAPCQLPEPPPIMGLSRETNKSCEIDRGLIRFKT